MLLTATVGTVEEHTDNAGADGVIEPGWEGVGVIGDIKGEETESQLDSSGSSSDDNAVLASQSQSN